MTTTYTPVILHVSHGSARGDVSLGGSAELSLFTSMDALADGLRKMHRNDATSEELLDELLATLSGLEASGLDRGALVRAALCQEITRREDAERQVATLTRERDEARAIVTDCHWIAGSHTGSPDHMADSLDNIKQITTPTPGAQA